MNDKIKYTCDICNKQYVRKDAYNKHILLCATINRTYNNKFNYKNKLQQETSENNYEPSNKELFIMLTNLNSKYNKLMDDYSTLKNYIDNLKNKTNILDYLNSNCQSDISIFQFINNINIDIQNLELIFKNGYLNGVYNILIEYFEKQTMDNIDIPIKAFTRKNNVCYINIYSDNNIDNNLNDNNLNDNNLNDNNLNDNNINDNNLNDNNSQSFNYKWIILDQDNLHKLFNILNSKILNIFTIWNKNAIKNMDYDKYSELYPVYMKKILGITNDSSFNLQITIKNKLYNYIKTEIKI